MNKSKPFKKKKTMKEGCKNTKLFKSILIFNEKFIKFESHFYYKFLKLNDISWAENIK